MSKGGGAFVQDLEELRQMVDEIADDDLDKLVDWTMRSLSSSVIKKIRTVWPVKTGLSRSKWGFKRVKQKEYEIFNDALNSVGKEYAGYVYKKGDRTRSPIAPNVVRNAILKTIPEVEDNFQKRFDKLMK